MAPKVKFQKEEIIAAAMEIVREKGIEALTAREVAAGLGVSTRPIFTYYETMDRLKHDVFEKAKDLYRSYIERGLEGPIPFLGVWQQYVNFVIAEPELYRLLFLTRHDAAIGGAMDALKFSQDLARDSIMRTYPMDAHQADCYFRDIWLVSFSFGALIVTGNCPYTYDEIFAIGAEISLSVCKAYKEIPGLPEGTYDRDAVFSELVKKQA